jgi:outer membrane protein
VDWYFRMTSYRFDRRPYRFVRLSAAAVIASVAMITPATAETLAEAVTLTYQNNPTLLGQRAELRALNESYVQARAGLRPQLSVSAEGDYSNNLSTAFTGLPVGAVGLSVSQPIYTGGAVTAQVRASIADIMASRERLLQTEANVLQNVIQYYADVLRDQQAVVIAQDSVSVLTRQREETQARLAAGDLTRTDVAQSEARLAAARAQLTSAEAQLAFSRANYAGVVGQNPGTLAPQSPLIGVPGNVDEALEAATNTGPLVLSAFYSEQAASAKVSQAKAAYHPSVSLQAQYGYQDYVSADPALNVRTGILERNLTASVVVVQPLYAGGANASHVRQARELDNALMGARANVTSEAEQARASQVAYEGVHEEQKVGLRTIIEVLNAEQELHSAELAEIGARHDEFVAAASVLNAMGRLGVQAISPDIKAYDPGDAFSKVKRAGALPWDPVVSALDSIGAPPNPRPPGATPSPPALTKVTESPSNGPPQ